MPRFESAIGQKEFDASSGMRKFTVDNQDAPPTPEMSPQDIMEARKRKIQEVNSVSDNVRRRIEMLVGIGRAKEDIQVQDGEAIVTYSVRTLKDYETKYVLAMASDLSSTSTNALLASHDLRERILSFALYAIDGIDINLALGVVGATEEEQLAARAAFIEQLDESVVGYIYGKYEQLNKRNMNRFSVKTEDEAKEVAEQMKKSGEGTRA